MNASYRGFLILALAGCYAPIQAQEPMLLTSPLPQVVVIGVPLHVLNRAYVADQKRWAAAARQYDKLMQGYPSAWAHYPYFTRHFLLSPIQQPALPYVAETPYAGSVASYEEGDGPYHIPWSTPPDDDFQLSWPETVPTPPANPSHPTEL